MPEKCSTLVGSGPYSQNRLHWLAKNKHSSLLTGASLTKKVQNIDRRLPIGSWSFKFHGNIKVLVFHYSLIAIKAIV
jgi:hypothetical protein